MDKVWCRHIDPSGLKRKIKERCHGELVEP
jgi:hypothetical protein